MPSITIEFDNPEKAEAFFRIFSNGDIKDIASAEKMTKGLNSVLYELELFEVQTKRSSDSNYYIKLLEDK